jgi:hypothetical protein
MMIGADGRGDSFVSKRWNDHSKGDNIVLHQTQCAFYFEFEPPATNAARLLEAEGYEASVDPAPDGSHWIVLASRSQQGVWGALTRFRVGGAGSRP